MTDTLTRDAIKAEWLVLSERYAEAKKAGRDVTAEVLSMRMDMLLDRAGKR